MTASLPLRPGWACSTDAPSPRTGRVLRGERVALGAVSAIGAGLVILAVLAPVAPRAHAQNPPAIEVEPDVTIFGGAEDTYLSVRGTADVNADGAAEALLDYAVRARGVEQAQQDLLIGRGDWPEEVELGKLEAVDSLGLPFIGNDMASRDGASFYGFRTFFDANGDGVPDMAAFDQTRRMSEVRAEDVKVYFGGPEWRTPDIKRGRGQLTISQDQVPQDPWQAERNPLAEQLLAGDFDGNGAQDIAIGSCHVERGQEFEEGQTGTMRLYLSEESGPPSAISLRGGAADVVLTGETGLAMGCFESFVGDFDGDGLDDVLVGGSELTQFGGSYAALLLGRDDWPSKAQIAELADVRFTHEVEQGGVRAVGALDLDEDGDLEAIFEYGEGHRVQGGCAWPGSAEMPDVAAATDCPLRFPDELPMAVADLDGDGLAELIYEMPYKAGDEGPYQYGVQRGPISGDVIAIGEKPGSRLGDAVLEIGPDLDQPEWRLDDMNGDGHVDLVLSRDSETNLEGDEFAGRVDLVFGPLVDATLWHSPPTITPEPTPTPATPPTATPGVEPTASPMPSEPAPTSPTIYLPVGLRAAALGADG